MFAVRIRCIFVPELLANLVELRIDDLVHGKHVYFVSLENAAHCIITDNLALIVRVLQVVRFDVLPYLLDGLRARELCFVDEG
jgi:hypothetical protein